MSRYIILLGPPGAGKGTQAELLQARLGLAHVSSGDLFRDHVARRTSLGTLAQRYMDKGELVPDQVTVQMVIERIQQPDCENGVVFDGFPRTDAQAQALDQALAEQRKKISAAILFDAPDDDLIARLSARRVCPKDNSVYNLLTNPPRVPGVCDKDGTPLEQRADDRPETVQHRLAVYKTQTEPLIEYYRRAGMLKPIRAERDIESIQSELVGLIERL